MRCVLLVCALALTALGGALGGDINDIEHVVIFMQENRAFDHYYGMLRGVRGFNDRTAVRLPSGLPVWFQPTSTTNTSAYMLPFHVDSHRTSATCMDAPEMSFPTDIGMINHGLYDAWNTAREPGYGMGYWTREDLPFYYALADAFTIGDQYFQSTFSATNPNRLFLFSGCNGLSVGYPPVMSNDEPVPGWQWPTLGEVLEERNISWRVYQEVDNFDDNGFAWFNSFQQAKPGSTLYEKGVRPVPDLVTAFGEAMDKGTLPSVTILIAPAWQSEHAQNHPAAGEDLSAQLIATLRARPHVYAKTAFILNYDEGGQFYDHHWTPTAPVNAADGKSTVDVSGDVLLKYGVPIGMGFRVPLFIISPWTRGGHVVSEVFDHSSVIRFLEKRFDFTMPTISPWRRAVAGDLTSCFDFNSPPDYSWPVFPDTSDFVNMSNYQCKNLPQPVVPQVQAMPTPEPGVRPSRLLPYEFHISDQVTAATIDITIEVAGDAGAPFVVYDLMSPKQPPRKYTVSAHMALSDSWPANTTYNLVLHGPNGFARQFVGAGNSVPQCTVSARYDVADGHLLLGLTNSAQTGTCDFVATDNAYNTGGPYKQQVGALATSWLPIPVSGSGNWYDVTVQSTDYSRRLMGRIERPGSTSDPATTNPLHPAPAHMSHPLVDEALAQHVYVPMCRLPHKDSVLSFQGARDCDLDVVVAEL